MKKTLERESYRFKAIFFALVTFVICGVLFYSPKININQDYIQYWSSWRLLREGQNPYDPSVIYQFQQHAGLQEAGPRMFWCPPWALILMQPVVSIHDLATSQFYWMKFCLFFFGISVIAVYAYLRKFLTKPLHHLLVLGFGFGMPQVWDLTLSAQISIVLLIWFLISLYFLENKNLLLAGIALAPLTIKPHLFYLVWIYLLWNLLINKEWRVPIGMFIGLLMLIVSSEIIMPGSVSFWLKTFEFSETDSIAVPRGSWTCATLPSILRLLLDAQNPSLNVIVPGVFGICLIWDLMKENIEISLKGVCLLLLPLSLLTAPYGWFFDEVVLLPLSMVLCVSILQLTQNALRFLLAIGYIGATLGALIMYLYFTQWQHQLWWVSMWFSCLTLLFWRRSKGTLLYHLSLN